MKKPLLKILLAVSPLLVTSCSTIGEAIVESMIDSVFESSTDRKIDSDTKRMKAGEPLKHYPSEKRLKLAREDRMLDSLMNH